MESSDTKSNLNNTPARSLALAGGLWGAASAIFLGGLRFARGGEPRTAEQLPGDVAFLMVYLAPFALSLIALRLNSPAPQGAIWGAGGILGFLASFTAFSGVTLLLLPAALLLLLAAVYSYRQTGARPFLAVFGPAIGLISAGIVAFLVLYSQPDPRCWVLVSAGGREHWEERPYSNSMTLGPEELQGVCTSDIITPIEAILSLGVWGISALGLFLLLPRWRPSLGARASA